MRSHPMVAQCSSGYARSLVLVRLIYCAMTYCLNGAAYAERKRVQNLQVGYAMEMRRKKKSIVKS